MYIAGRWADRQLSRLELVIVVIVLSLVLFVFMHYMLRMFAIAERSLLANSVININSAIQYRAAGYALRRDYASLEAMQGMNPFTMSDLDPGWLDPESGDGRPQEMLTGIPFMRVPGNYLGELDNPDPAEIGGRQWYFNLRDRTLVYRVDNTEYFDSSLPGPPRVVFTVKIDYQDRNTNNKFDPVVDEYLGIRLQAVNEYGWHYNFTGEGD